MLSAKEELFFRRFKQGCAIDTHRRFEEAGIQKTVLNHSSELDSELMCVGK